MSSPGREEHQSHMTRVFQQIICFKEKGLLGTVIKLLHAGGPVGTSTSRKAHKALFRIKFTKV